MHVTRQFLVVAALGLSVLLGYQKEKESSREEQV